ncbi:SLAP domain-containing protein [Clostridium bowmanii]|uniref:SLAP domain-containing protein n=1 Tax=Clostridium bowmanii TaxID=132925 RepID=UPI001C0DFEF8|nr:SLAP domain-containing protein [Clostridium bowmanii]MBU3190272.1 SLAP domain-containing protein [Clostridium bowmanii]MCA1072516.1 SLAP domain-containing protein [Clostridium bowmanii]
MSNINKQKSGNDTIVIKDKLNGLVTITTEDLSKRDLTNSFIYKICPDGKILNVHEENKIDEKLEKASVKNPREILIEKSIKGGFEKISDDLTDLELVRILEFSEREIVKNNDSRMVLFSVETTNSGDLKVILLMYNGSKSEMTIDKFPFKLKDAKDKVITVGLIDINKTISPSKIAICEVQIEKALLNEQEVDLTTWTVTFEME